ncbi:MAG: BON domain-containing protein [bacterium]
MALRAGAALRTALSLRASVIVLAAAVSGCTPVVTGMTVWVYEDRSAKVQLRDAAIHAGIIARFTGKDAALPIDVDTEVWEGRVLLTGMLDDPALRDEVGALVRKDSRVRALYNEIQIVSKEEKESRRKERKKEEERRQKSEKEEAEGLGRIVGDAWVEAKIKTQLLLAGGVKSVNYRWQSVRRRVFIIGRALSGRERATVLRILRQTDGVKSVKDFIEVKE